MGGPDFPNQTQKLKVFFFFLLTRKQQDSPHVVLLNSLCFSPFFFFHFIDLLNRLIGPFPCRLPYIIIFVSLFPAWVVYPVSPSECLVKGKLKLD